jgi:hypothetical protein
MNYDPQKYQSSANIRHMFIGNSIITGTQQLNSKNELRISIRAAPKAVRGVFSIASEKAPRTVLLIWKGASKGCKPLPEKVHLRHQRDIVFESVDSFFVNFHQIESDSRLFSLILGDRY